MRPALVRAFILVMLPAIILLIIVGRVGEAFVSAFILIWCDLRIELADFLDMWRIGRLD